MYGRAIQCDVCDRMEIVDEWRETFFDAGFRGWIRVTVNEPRDYGWTFRDAKHATTVTSIDACSIDCAQKFLRETHKTIPVDEQVQA